MAGSWYINGDGPMCSNAFTDYFQRAVLAYYCLYLFFSLLILLACCCLYKRSGTGKKLIGPTYIVALLFAIFAYMLNLASLIMRECGVDNPEQDEALYCAISILDYLSMWALLLIVFYNLNSMLRKKLGSTGRVFTAIPLALCGIVLALTLVYLAMSNYIYMSRALGERTSDTMAYATERLGMALRVIYLFSVMISFAFSVMNISALRRAHLPGGDLTGWVIGLHVCMFIWSLLAVITTGLTAFTDIWKLDMSLGLLYVTTLFQTLSFVFVLGIAKHVCWRNEIPAQQVFAPVTHEQEAYKYASGEQNYYQSPPEIIHAK